MNTAIILVLNCGSSSLKFGLYQLKSPSINTFKEESFIDDSFEYQSSQIKTLFSGEAESVATDHGRFHAKNSCGTPLFDEALNFASHKEAILHIVGLLAELNMPAPIAVGHRVVHGGFKLRQHCMIDDVVIKKIEAASSFAPLHNKAALSVIKMTKAVFPDLPQIACFDTIFHAEMPEVASMLPIPKVLQLEGMRRYGFHGLSCESILHQLGVKLPKRLVIAHLGNGASITAIKNGKSIDTSMGLTPTGGMMMSTRSGDIDPGILIYLMREKRFDAAMLENLVDHQSGLLGISGVDSDMQRLRQAEKSNHYAKLAIQMFCYAAQKQIAAMISVLGGINMLVFTGGIGENDYETRAKIVEGLTWAGVNLNATKIQCTQHYSKNYSIQDATSHCELKVIASNEDEQIARHTLTLLNEYTFN